jgi:flagellar protein FliO/FliZ
MIRIFAVSLLTLVPQLIWAAGQAAPAESLLIPVLKMLAALAVVVGLLLLFYAASRRGFGFLPKPRDGQIQMLETRALGGKKYLSLVRVRDRELLLGISNERIDCLAEFPSAAAGFATTLDRLAGKTVLPPETAP